MSKVKLTLPGTEIPVTGKQVTFNAPCDCSVVDCIQIDGVDYCVVDSLGHIVTGKIGTWLAGSQVSVILDVENKKAYLQNISTYNKVETLTDATKTMLGFDSSAGPDDVFQALIVPRGKYGFCVKVTFEDGTPIEGLELNGLIDLQGNPAVTDKNGLAACVSDVDTISVTISGLVGIVDKEASITATPNTRITFVDFVVEKDTSIKLVQTSQTMKIYNVGTTVDFCLVGGGAGGNAYLTSANQTRAGGGGGYVENILGVTLENPEVILSVGAGGGPCGDNGAFNSGGESSLVYDGITVTAAGAANQTGNGNGGSGNQPGEDGKVRVFNDDTLPLPGGGGGGGSVTAGTVHAGGKDFGGMGGVSTSSTSGSAGNGTGPGGGGGGGAKKYTNGKTNAGSGAAGGLYIRVNFPNSEVTA